MSGQLLMLDLFSGLGGASQAMVERGWRVVRVDNDPHFKPDVLADIQGWSWTGERPDLVWASPPCVEFSRESMPWCRTGQEPDTSLLEAAVRVISESGAPFWVLENVRGARRYVESTLKDYGLLLAPSFKRVGPFFLWGQYPIFDVVSNGRKKESYSSTQQAERARIPYAVSLALAQAVEQFSEAGRQR